MNNETGIWEELPDELYVIGDIHGDFYALKQALILTGCVMFEEINTSEIVKQYGSEIIVLDGCDYYDNKKITWNKNKKNCIIAFAGDLIDRCRNIINNYCSVVVYDEDCDYKILKLLLDLNKQATIYNSNVVIVLGNHEIMNLEEKLQYVSRKGLLNENKRKNDIKKLITDNKYNLYGIVRIGNYVICHGGINPTFIEENKHYFDNKKEFIEYYNNHVRNFILDTNYKYNYLITNKNSPFWDRTNGLNNIALSELDCKKIFQDNLLNIQSNSLNKQSNSLNKQDQSPIKNLNIKGPINNLNVRGYVNILNIHGNVTNLNFKGGNTITNMNNLKIIVAHCPQIINSPKMGINNTNCGTFQNRIWRVDIAMSRAFDTYVSEDIMNLLLIELQNKITNNIPFDLDFILSFNIPFESTNRNVQLLHITQNSESIILGESSLRYFYKDVFNNNNLLITLYMLQDIESNYKYLYTNVYDPSTLINSITELLIKLKDILYKKIFNNKQQYYISYKK